MSEKNPRRRGLTRKQEAAVANICMKATPTVDNVDFLRMIIEELRDRLTAAENEPLGLIKHILHECDSADSFGDDIETEDVRFWLQEYKP